MLYSTKRKWEKLIHNNSASVANSKEEKTVSSVATPSVSSSPVRPTETTVDLKKRKLTELPISPRPSVRAVSPTGSTKSRITTTSSSLRADGGATSASYAPWDRDAFLVRLGTFRYVDKWLAKPAVVNEVAWAKRGWICLEKNRVRCNACRREVLVEIESDDEHSEEGKAMVELYESMIITEHDENCLWRRRGCDETIYRLQQLANSSDARSEFTSRYVSLAKIRSELPPSLSYPDNVSPESLHYPSECSEEGPVFEAAAVIALFGWQSEDPGIPSLVSCAHCFRRLGLWLFTKKASSTGEGIEQSEASVCRLDVVGEHRDYCPWVNASSQGKEAGWSKLLRVLQRPSKGMSGAASVYTVASIAPTEKSVDLSNVERDANDESKLQKLKRLKSLYFGKKKKETKDKPKEKGKGGQTQAED
ncbi:C3HC zinc finger-like-domain-containing protein [Geopyxis carbonaria]|nr:C3HC zinc finger-like-domain-containing protein [Geopyxis carbonaria]